MDTEFSRGDAYRAIAARIKAEPLGEFYGEAALIYFHDALDAGETPKMALAISNKETDWPELSPKLPKEFEDLTSLCAALLMGNHLGPLYKICEGQSSISTRKLQKLVYDLKEHDRKLAVALIELRDHLSPDTVPMPRELTAEQGFKYALIGEFSESHQVVCHYCDLGLINTEYDDIEDETCPECEGEYIHTVDWDISWTNIKAIYKAAVAHFHPVSDARGDSE